MDASVFICTYNRCDSLRRTLRSLERMEVPGKVQYEVVVIDNNSSDDTSQVLSEFADRLPLVRGVEERSGKSYALNSGVELCQGRVILLTDDDVEVEPNWLAVMMQAFAERQADAVFGRIRPLWPGAIPAWFDMRIGAALALLDYGAEGRFLEPDQPGFFGANVAITRAAIEAMGRWDTALNRAGDNLIMGEDTALCEKLVHAGRKVWYEPASVVGHDVRAERTTRSYFRRWFMAHGQSSALKGVEWKPARLAIAGVPLYLFRMAFGFWVKALSCRLRGHPAEAFYIELRAWRAMGAMRQFLSMTSS